MSLIYTYICIYIYLYIRVYITQTIISNAFDHMHFIDDTHTHTNTQQSTKHEKLEETPKRK